MSKTMAKRLAQARKRLALQETELRYLRENRVRYQHALRDTRLELETGRAVLTVLAQNEIIVQRADILSADASRLRAMLSEDQKELRIWVQSEKALS